MKKARQRVTDLIENRHVPRIGKYENVLYVVENYQEDEMSQTGEHPYYTVRCQKRVLLTQKIWLKICYPNMYNKCDSYME